MSYIQSFFNLLNVMSPYLLLGFLMAGVLHTFVPKAFYSKYLSKPSFSSVLKATLLGIPLPLCSCGTIPVAMSLHKDGASKGSVIAFLIATPQTGVDSIVATYSIMGLPMAVLRPVAALITAVVGGSISECFLSKNDFKLKDEVSQQVQKMTLIQMCYQALYYGFFEILQNIGKWLLIGLLLGAAITTFVPQDAFSTFADYPILNMLVVLILAIPMYLCATGSIPIAAALMLKGMTPGSALVLLMAGPAVSIASIMVVAKAMGKRSLVFYLASIVLGSLFLGLGVDYLLPRELFQNGLSSAMLHRHVTWLNWLSSSVLLGLTSVALVMRYKKQGVVMVNGDTKTYKIKGMECNHCKMSVENNLKKLDGVTDVQVDLAKGEAYVSGSATPSQIKEVVKSIGFEVE